VATFLSGRGVSLPSQGPGLTFLSGRGTVAQAQGYTADNLPPALTIGSTRAQRQQLANQLNAGLPIGSSPGGGFLGALARDFASVVTSVPASAVFLGRVASSANPVNLALWGASEVPGLRSLPGAAALRGYQRGTTSQVIEASRALAADYAYRYGDIGEIPSRFMAHPLPYLLDLGALYSGAGKGASLAARTTGFGPGGRFTVAAGEGSAGRRFLSYIGDTDPAGRRRLRPDRRIDVPAEATAEDLAPAWRPRHAGSLNPLTNRVQQAIDRFIDRRDLTRGGTSIGPERLGSFVNPLSATGRYEREARRVGGVIRMESTDVARRDFTRTTREYQRIVRKLNPLRKRLTGRGEGPVDEALFLHVTGMLDFKALGFHSPMEALEGAIDYWRAGIEEAKGRKERVTASEKALAKFEELRDHPELLDLDEAPPALREAVPEARKLISEGQDRLETGQEIARPATGLLTRDMIEESRQRIARQVHGGSTQSDLLVRPDKEVMVPGFDEPQTLRGLEEQRQALRQEVSRIGSPAARKEAYAEALSAERKIREGIQTFHRGLREDGIRMIREGRQQLDQLLEDSKARLPGGRSELGPADIPEFRQVDTAERARTRANELEADAQALEDRIRPLIEFFSKRSGDRGSNNAFMSADQELGRALDDLERRSGAEGLSIRDLFVKDDLYPLIRDVVTPSEPVKWRAGKIPRGVSKETRAMMERVNEIDQGRLQIHNREKVGRATVKDAERKAELESERAALVERISQALRDEAAARNERRGATLPDRLARMRERVSGGRLRPDTLGAMSAEIGALHGQRPLELYALVRDARREVETLVHEPGRQAAAQRWLDVVTDAYRQSVAERVALIPDGPERDAALKFIARDDVPLELPEGDLPIRHPQEVLAALQEISGLRAQAEMIRRAVDQRVGESAASIEVPEVVRSLDAIYAELESELGRERVMVSSRRRRARNAQAPGPLAAVRPPAGQVAASRRQAGRMFGEGGTVPQGRRATGTDVPGLVGKPVRTERERMTPVEEAVAAIERGETNGIIALERMIPAAMAAEHRAAIAEVYESLGAIRASFGGTPAEMKATLDELRKVRRAIKVARDKSTGGWTTPRTIDAMHAQVPQTPEMAQALTAIARRREALADIEEEIRGIQELRQEADPDAVARLRSLQAARARTQTAIDRAEIAYHELETHEGIALFGEFADVEGSYWKMRPMKGQKVKPEREDRGGTPRPGNRMTAERIYRNRGRLLRTLNFTYGRRDPLNMVMQGIRAEHSAHALRQLMDRAGVRWASDRFDGAGILQGEAGDLVRGPLVLTMLKDSPDLFRAVHVPSMHDVLERLREEEVDGEWDTSSALEAVFYSQERTDEISRALVQGEWRADDVMLLPKAAVDEYVDAAHGIFRGYDNALGLWKAGVLAFTPRWYILNLIGNSLQYGLMSGGDVRSILLAGLGKRIALTKASRARYAELEERFAERVPEELASVSQASETGVREGVAKLGGIADRLFEFNAGLEGLIRRAAFINSAKRQIKYAGKRGETRSAEQLLQAIDELPDVTKAEALREALFFLGDYRSFNRFERGFVRRIMPFYSWVRVITRLTLGLPFKSPLRAEVLQALSTAMQAEWDPLDEALELGRPVFARGAIELPSEIPVIGGMTLRTNALNPFATTADLYPSALEALGREGPSAALGELVQSVAPSLAPGTTAVIEAATPGFNVFGNRAVSAPPGYGGLIQAFGGSFLAPSGQGYQRVSGPSTPFLENVLQSLLPYYGSTARNLLAGTDKPYDTATLLSIAAQRVGLSGRIPGVYDARPGQVFRPPSQYEPIARPSALIGPLSSWLGFPLENRNEIAEAEARLRDYEAAARAREQTQARYLSALQRGGG
jgi:hypothetical protein